MLIFYKLKYHLVTPLLVLLFCLNFSVIARSQSTDTTRIIVENGWIEKTDNQIGFKISMDNDYETFKVSTEFNDIVLYPNISTVGIFSFTYRFLSASYGVAPDFFPGNGDNDIKGNTRAFGFGLSSYFRHWFQNLRYSRVQGYYLKNTSDYIDWKEGDPYIQFPDLVYTGFSCYTGYSLNPKLSLKSITSQTERQLKSAGSFIGLLNYRFYIIDDKSTSSPSGNTQKSNNLEISLGPGYSYTYVLKERFYASLGFTPGIGYIQTWLTTRTNSVDYKTTQHNWAFRWDVKGGLGYNGRTFFSGIYGSVAGMKYRQENTTVVNFDTRIFIQGFFGFRIKAPAPVNRFFDSLPF
jgi:hypothetical protein